MVSMRRLEWRASFPCVRRALHRRDRVGLHRLGEPDGSAHRCAEGDGDAAADVVARASRERAPRNCSATRGWLLRLLPGEKKLGTREVAWQG